MLRYVFAIFLTLAFVPQAYACEALAVNKTTITDADVLTIKLKNCGKQRFSALGIRTPTQDVYYYITDNVPGKMMYNKAQFQYIDTLTFPVATFKAVPENYNMKTAQKVFDVKGDYEIRFGIDLHTDDHMPDELSTVTVHYTPSTPTSTPPSEKNDPKAPAKNAR